MTASFTRLYSDAEGASHFEDLDANLSIVDFIPSAAPLHLSDSVPATQFSFFGAQSGWQSDWHPSTARNLFVVVSGEWEVTASDLETRRFAAGSVLLVEDTTGTGHKSRVISADDSVSILVQLPS